MQVDPQTKKAAADIGEFIENQYGGMLGVFRSADAVSALGALAGVFAQSQARSMLWSRRIPLTDSSIKPVITRSGPVHFVGDAIGQCLFEGTADGPSFWSLASAVAHDVNIAKAINLEEIAKHTAYAIGKPTFGKPRIDARYRLNEMPIDAVRQHAPSWWRRFRDNRFDASQLMTAFGLAAQALGPIAAGEVAERTVDVPMTRTDIVRLYMESAIPMSTLDLVAIGMVE